MLFHVFVSYLIQKLVTYKNLSKIQKIQLKILLRRLKKGRERERESKINVQLTYYGPYIHLTVIPKKIYRHFEILIYLFYIFSEERFIEVPHKSVINRVDAYGMSQLLVYKI